MNNQELQYLNLLKDVMDNGFDRDDRTGVGTKALFGKTMEFDLTSFPLYTTRKIAFRIAFEENMFFLRGETDTKKLEEKKIFIWKGNTTREFLDGVGLNDLPEGDMGKGYSWQWRNFGGDLAVNNPLGAPTGGIDQVKNLLEGIKKAPHGRRHLISAWNPSQLAESALPPCHILHQYFVHDGKLSCAFVMRSNDLYHGNPYNIAGYAFLTYLFAEILDLKPGKLFYTGHDAHIYKSQFDVVREQLKREPNEFPHLRFKKKIRSLEEALDLEYNDVELVGYNHKGALKKVPMAV